MFGPSPRGTWTSRLTAAPFKHLDVGEIYEVIDSFADFDGVVHPAGERWTFLGHNFLPYDDGLSLFVSLDGEREWHMRLQWREDAQAAIVDNLQRYFQPVEAELRSL